MILSAGATTASPLKWIVNCCGSVIYDNSVAKAGKTHAPCPPLLSGLHHRNTHLESCRHCDVDQGIQTELVAPPGEEMVGARRRDPKPLRGGGLSQPPFRDGLLNRNHRF